MRLTTRRAAIIVSRVRLLSLAFALLTPLWGIAEYWTLAPTTRIELAPIAVLASAAFAAILALTQGKHTLGDAYRGLVLLFASLGAFFLYCYLTAVHLDADGVLDGLAAGYAHLPFVMLACLAVFPLTAVESGLLAGFVLLAQVLAWLPNLPTLHWMTAIGWMGMLVLIGLLAILASVSQMAFLFVMVREGLHDSLTGCYSRRAGEELLDLQFTWCRRGQGNLSVALLAPDGLQALNERYGYEAGDAVLKDVTVRLHDSMRAGDILIRWLGNEFLMVMPLASREQAAGAVQRLLASGMGVDPGGKAITASIGIAERTGDEAEDWWMLVDAATARAKAARDAGGNRTIDR
jgi:diguanylate cyclase (GGDEF)-like protein